MQALTREQVRGIDQRAVAEFHVPSILLMENAGKGAAELLIRCGCSGRVIILCGTGNNAGDGLVVARHLDIASISVQIICARDPADWRGDVATNYAIIRASGIPLAQWDSSADPALLEKQIVDADWIVDAMLGTGATGAPRSPFDHWNRLANGSTARRLALDIPSGMDCDTGQPHEPTFRAHETCTFVAAKVGFQNPEAKPYLGTVHVVGIGAPRQSYGN